MSDDFGTNMSLATTPNQTPEPHDDRSNNINNNTQAVEYMASQRTSNHGGDDQQENYVMTASSSYRMSAAGPDDETHSIGNSTVSSLSTRLSSGHQQHHPPSDTHLQYTHMGSVGGVGAVYSTTYGSHPTPPFRSHHPLVGHPSVGIPAASLTPRSTTIHQLHHHHRSLPSPASTTASQLSSPSLYSHHHHDVVTARRAAHRRSQLRSWNPSQDYLSTSSRVAGRRHLPSPPTLAPSPPGSSGRFMPAPAMTMMPPPVTLEPVDDADTRTPPSSTPHQTTATAIGTFRRSNDNGLSSTSEMLQPPTFVVQQPENPLGVVESAGTKNDDESSSSSSKSSLGVSSASSSSESDESISNADADQPSERDDVFDDNVELTEEDVSDNNTPYIARGTQEGMSLVVVGSESEENVAAPVAFPTTTTNVAPLMPTSYTTSTRYIAGHHQRVRPSLTTSSSSSDTATPASSSCCGGSNLNNNNTAAGGSAGRIIMPTTTNNGGDEHNNDQNSYITHEGAVDSKYDMYPCFVDSRQQDRSVEVHLNSWKRPHMRAFHFAWMGFFVAFFLWFAITPLLSEVQVSLDLTKQQIWTSNLYAVAGSAVTRILIGPFCDSYGARLAMSATLIISSIPTMLTGIVRTSCGLNALRLFIGIAGSAFVTCQYWTSSMFTREVVGTANALVAGWGNLGGGVTQVVMGSVFFPLFKWIYSSTSSGEDGESYDRASDLAWRSVCVIPGIMGLCMGYLVFQYSDDSPKGNLHKRRKEQEQRKKNNCSSRTCTTTTSTTTATATTDLNNDIRIFFHRMYQAGQNYNTWLLFVQYGCCFGVEITMVNAAALYFKEEFGQTTEGAAAIASIFGWMNLFARGVGGFCSDMANAGCGMRGRLVVQVITLVLEGALVLVFARTDTLIGAIFVMMVFSFFVQAAEGSTFGIVPYVDPESTGSISGVVGAGGNVGGVLFAFLFREMNNYRTAFRIMGFVVMTSAILTIPISISGYGGLFFRSSSPLFVESQRGQRRPRRVNDNNDALVVQSAATSCRNDNNNRTSSDDLHADAGVGDHELTTTTAATDHTNNVVVLVADDDSEEETLPRRQKQQQHEDSSVLQEELRHEEASSMIHEV